MRLYARVQILERDHIDLAVDVQTQLIFGVDDVPARRPALLKLIQHIDIAVGRKVFAQDRAEQP